MALTVADLIEFLEDCNPDAEVRLAMQPRWPFEYSIDGFSLMESETDDGPVVYLPEGQQLNYLPGNVQEDLGWCDR